MSTKKELKEAYKQYKPQMGVFQIKNKETGRVLIDHSTDVNARWNRHQAQLRFGSHLNKTLQKDWNDLGADQFEFSLLSEMEYQEEGNPDYQKELEVLQDLLVGELNTDESKLY